jgi:hypothetical protein
MRCGSLRAFQKYIVVRVGAGTHLLVGFTQTPPSRIVRRTVAISLSLRLNLGRRMTSSYSAKNIPAYAQLYVGVQNDHQKYLRWLSLRTEQGGNQDVGIEDNPDHCSWGC